MVIGNTVMTVNVALVLKWMSKRIIRIKRVNKNHNKIKLWIQKWFTFLYPIDTFY